jgi:hypothetical protein
MNPKECVIRRINTMDWKDPEIVSEPRQDRCQRCDIEPAEHRVRDFGQEPADEPFNWDLCGTCYLEMLNAGRRTPEEDCAYWDQRHDRRFDPQP